MKRSIWPGMTWVTVTLLTSACGKGAVETSTSAPAPIAAPADAAAATPTPPNPATPSTSATPEPAADAAPTPEPAADAAPTPEPAADSELAPEPAADAAPAPDAAAASDRPRGQETELPAGEDNLFDRLGRVIGQGAPVAIVPTIEGLAAVSADGTRWTLLYKGVVPWAVVDERARVVWFGQAIDIPTTGNDISEDEESVSVHALDLLAPTIAPARISSRLPAASAFVVSYPKLGPEGRDEQVWSVIGQGAITTLVVDPKRPRLEASGGIYMEIGMVDGAAHRAAVKAGALDKDAVGFVKGIAARSAERTNTRPRPAQPALPDRLEVPTTGCEDPEMCGTWRAWPGQPWVAVVIEHACGDACHTRMALWHVEKKTFLALDDGPGGAIPTGEAGLFYPIVAPDGSAWLEAGTLMRPGSKPWAWPVPKDVFFTAWGGGWLGGQFTLY